MDIEIEKTPVRVRLSFEGGKGKLLLNCGGAVQELTARQADELAEVLKEQSYNLRRVEG